MTALFVIQFMGIQFENSIFDSNENDFERMKTKHWKVETIPYVEHIELYWIW